MKNSVKILFTVLISVNLTSCSLFFGGIVALDNSAKKGSKEVKEDKMIKLDNGEKIILELTDSTKVSGIYLGYKEFDEEEQEIKSITILTENNELKFYNSPEINKYYYVGNGVDIWIAVAFGAYIDALIIHAIVQGPQIRSGKFY